MITLNTGWWMMPGKFNNRTPTAVVWLVAYRYLLFWSLDYSKMSLMKRPISVTLFCKPVFSPLLSVPFLKNDMLQDLIIDWHGGNYQCRFVSCRHKSTLKLSSKQKYYGLLLFDQRAYFYCVSNLDQNEKNKQKRSKGHNWHSLYFIFYT